MPPPLLQFAAVGPVAISGSGAPDKNSVLRTLSSLITSSSLCWEVDNTDITGSNVVALVLRPRQSSATPNMRVVICGDFSQANSGTFMQAYQAVGTADDAPAGDLMIGFAPNTAEYGSGSYVAGRWDGPAPFGTNPRWSKYWSMGTRSNMQYIGLVESTETLFIYTKKASSGEGTNYAAYVGAIISGFDSGSSESGRVYGMGTTGQESANTGFWSSQALFMGQTEVVNSSHFGCFLTSGSYASNGWDLITHLYTMNEAAAFPGSTTSNGQSIVGQPVLMTSTVTPRSPGYLRQVYMHQDSYSSPIALVVSGANSATGQVVAVIWSPANQTVCDSLLFGSTGSV